jgi:hypothetical protein
MIKLDRHQQTPLLFSYSLVIKIMIITSKKQKEKGMYYYCILFTPVSISFSFINLNLNVCITCFYVRPDVPIKINPMHHRLVGIYPCVFINEGVFTIREKSL